MDVKESKKSEYELLTGLRERLANGVQTEDDLIILQLVNLIDDKNKKIKETLEEVRTVQGEIKKVEENSRRDGLTGLYNSNAILPYFKKQYDVNESSVRIEPLEKLTIVAIDLDHFKNINDTYGHHIGDAALQVVADGMIRFFKQKDLIARPHGDEFLLLVKNCDESILKYKLDEMSRYITECLHKKLDNTLVTDKDGNQYYVDRDVEYTLSCGYADANLETLTPDLLENPEAFNNWFTEQWKPADKMSYAVKEEHHAVRK